MYHSIYNKLPRYQFTFSDLIFAWFKKVTAQRILLSLVNLFFCLSFFSFLQAEDNITISGFISDPKGNSLAGTNLQIKSLSIGTVSDTNGFYQIILPAGMALDQQLEITAQYVGYKSKSKKVILNSTTNIVHFTLQEDLFQSETIVVTGIASKTAKQFAAVAVSSINATDYTETSSYQSMSQLLSGKFSGIQVTPTSGNTGGGFRFFMRSGGGLIGDEQPIIYIDGMRIDNSSIAGRYTAGGQDMSILANLNPQDIDKIEVLKGPAGAATYGTSGSNGVILISTKKGITTPAINYKYLYGFNTQSYQYSKNDYYSADHANAIFRNGLIQEHFINLSGGQNYFNYYTSFDHRLEQGIISGDRMERKNIKLNFTTLPYEKVKININTGYTQNKINRPQNDNNGFGYLANTLSSPTAYIYTDSAAITAIKDINKCDQFIGSCQIHYHPVEKLEANFCLGIDASHWRQDQTFPKNYEYAIFTDGAKSIYNRYTRLLTYDFNLNYKVNLLPSLDLTSIIGTQCIEEKLTTSYLRSEEFGSDLIQDIGSGKKVSDWGEYSAMNREAGLFTEHSLSYLDQYYMTVGLRKDYGSSYSNQATSIYYPTARLAVRLDRYPRFPAIFNLMKVRLAYGETGMLPDAYRLIPYLWRSEIGGYGVGAKLASIGNPSVKPERIKELEAGFDTEIFNRYSLEFTCYYQKATDSQVPKNLAPSTGQTATGVLYNIGEVWGWGIETLLKASLIPNENCQLDLNLIVNYQTNEIIDLGGSPPFYDGYGINILKDKLSKHEFYAFEVLGAEFDNNGRVIKETDNTNIRVKTTPDKVALGNPIPAVNGSYTMHLGFLKKIEFFIMSDWALGLKIYNKTKHWATINGNNTEHGQLAEKLSSLRPNTPEYRETADKFARMNPYYIGNFIEDADFLKIREVGISYSFKDLLTNKIIKDITLGISMRNVLTFTKYSGPDPEVSADGSRSLTRGVDFFTLQSPKVYNLWLKLSI
jgi:TonB-dependent SusC/RagA subfamily outer membrane receptor